MKKRRTVFIVFCALTAGCTTVQEIRRPNGEIEYLIACGASTGWNVCYDKANEVCPDGYITLSEDAGFNRKELRIVCKGMRPPQVRKKSHNTSSNE